MTSEIIAWMPAVAACSVFLYRLLASASRRSTGLQLSLALFSSTGVLLGMGSIEMAGRYGFATIVAFIALTLLFVFSPLMQFPIQRLKNITYFATIIDLLAFRYRSRPAVAISSICLLLACTPLLMAQLRGIQTIFDFLVPAAADALLAGTLLLILAVSWRLNSSSLRNLMAMSGLLTLGALLLNGGAALLSVFGNIHQMNNWVVSSGQQEAVHRLDASYSLFAVFLAASMAAPLHFKLLVSDDRRTRKKVSTEWGYPLLIYLATLPVFPLLWSGIAGNSDAALQDYLFSLPATIHPVFAALGATSLLLLATTTLVALLLVLSKITLNGLLLPALRVDNQTNLDDWMRMRIRFISALLLLVCFALLLVSSRRSITDLYLLAFSGIAQLAPGLLAVVYAPRINRYGVTSGLIGGMLVWLVTLLFPLLAGGHWNLMDADTGIFFGMANWGKWTMQAVLVNLSLCVLVSLLVKTDPEEKTYARLCMVDNVYIPARVEMATNTVPEIAARLRQELGKEGQRQLAAALLDLDMRSDETRPAAMRRLREQLNVRLSMRLGTLATARLMEKVLPQVNTEQEEPGDIELIESVISLHSEQLTGLADELNRLRLHHREILNKLPVGVISVDTGGEILLWNQCMVDYSGIKRDLAVGAKLADLELPWGFLLRDFNDGEISTSDPTRLIVDQGELWIRLQKSADSSESSDCIILVEDVTETVRLTRGYLQRERLASIGRLAAGVAHEIGNPVTAISCIAQDLRREIPDQESAASVQQILDQTERINRIVHSLLNFSRGDPEYPQTPEAINLKAVADYAIELLLLERDGSRVRIRNTIENSFHLSGDHHQLVQVFLNLLSNARDASFEDGPILVEAQQAEDGRISVHITDQGCGIDHDIGDKLFEPFATSKNPGEGTGLGLWIVYTLVKNLGGDISIVSPAINSERGTTVTLNFPAGRTET